MWRSRKQTIVTLSSAEAEYVALSTCAREVTWMRSMLREMTQQRPWLFECQLPTTTILIDSRAARSMPESSVLSHRTKHISIKYHHVRDLVKNGFLHLSQVPSAANPANLLTKVMPRESLTRMVQLSMQEDKTDQMMD